MKYYNLFQIYSDKIVPLKKERWALLITFLFLYFIRILVLHSHYLITYCLSIYLLHGLIGFCTPKEEKIPDVFENFDADDYIPQPINDEFRPFMRRLPEFDFWMLSFKLVGLSFLATFFSFLDIPVYVPILIVYFIVISCLTARNLYRHMKKYQYDPFFTQKTAYGVNK